METKMQQSCLVITLTFLSLVLSVDACCETRDWNAEAQYDLKMALKRRINKNKAKNVILFIGDALGPSTVTASRFYHAESRNIPLKNAALVWETFPDVALSKTYSVDRMTTGSAASGTAYLCGVKSKFGTVGVNQNVIRGDCTTLQGNEVQSIVKKSTDEGKWSGVVTNTRVTHASPASAYASSVDRNWEAFIPDGVPNAHLCTDIAKQMIANHKNYRLAFGGGKKMFLPKGSTPSAQRKDGVNLINVWKENKRKQGLSPDQYAFLETKEDFDNVNLNRMEYMLGLFADSHMDYEVDRIRRPEINQPSLTEMVEKAIRFLSKGPKGYFLFVEAGRIDHAHHDNNAFRALNDTIAMHDAVKRAVEITDESDTLIVASADHSTGMVLSGYPGIHNPILGLIDEPAEPFDDGKPATSLMYMDGPGFYQHRMKNGKEVPRKDLTNVDTEAFDYLQDTALRKEYNTHGGEDVAIYARGPMSYLFNGVHEQNYITHVLMYASRVGPYRRRVCKGRRRRQCP